MSMEFGDVKSLCLCELLCGKKTWRVSKPQLEIGPRIYNVKVNALIIVSTMLFEEIMFRIVLYLRSDEFTSQWGPLYSSYERIKSTTTGCR